MGSISSVIEFRPLSMWHCRDSNLGVMGLDALMLCLRKASQWSQFQGFEARWLVVERRGSNDLSIAWQLQLEL